VINGPVVLGMDFGGTKIAVAVCDVDGVRLGSTTVQSSAVGGAQASLDRGIAAAQALLDNVAPGRRLAAVGACTFGIPGDDRIDLAPNIPGWSELALGRELRRVFGGVEIRLATDVKAAAQAEAQWGALVGCDPGIYLNLGTGLAVAIVANGAVLHGRHGAAGEIGYNLRSLADVGVALDARSPLEDSVSGKALAEEAARLAHGVVNPDGRGDVERLFEAAVLDPAAATAVANFVAELAFHLVNLAIAIDPVRIVVGGGMVRSWQHLETRLRRALDAAVPFPPELAVADFPFDAPLMGALALGTAAARATSNQGAPA
jgi:glucokinase